MELTMALVSIAVSFIAAVASVINLFFTKRKLYNATLTDKRIDWTITVRELLLDFVKLHIEKASEGELFQKKLEVQIYFNLTANPDQRELYQTMVACLNTGELDIDLYMKQCAQVLANNWKRIKMESGFLLKDEKKIRDVIYKKYKGKTLEELHHEIHLDYFKCRKSKEEPTVLQRIAGHTYCREVRHTRRHSNRNVRRRRGYTP